jgi:hypothetical protein
MDCISTHFSSLSTLSHPTLLLTCVCQPLVILCVREKGRKRCGRALVDTRCLEASFHPDQTSPGTHAPLYLPPVSPLSAYIATFSHLPPVVTHMRTNAPSLPSAASTRDAACHRCYLQLPKPPRQLPGIRFSPHLAACPWSPPMGDVHARPGRSTSTTPHPHHGALSPSTVDERRVPALLDKHRRKPCPSLCFLSSMPCPFFLSNTLLAAKNL